MIKTKVNLVEEMVKNNPMPDLVREAQEILNQAVDEEETILKNLGFSEKLKQRENAKDGIKLNEKILSYSNHYGSEKIFTLEQIRKICFDYGLRFLPTKYYRGEIPRESVREMGKFRNEGVGKDVYIMAPKVMFTTEPKPKRDPMVFIELTDDIFLLIAKWGGEFNKTRKLIYNNVNSYVSMGSLRFGLFNSIIISSFVMLLILTCTSLGGGSLGFIVFIGLGIFFISYMLSSIIREILRENFLFGQFWRTQVEK